MPSNTKLPIRSLESSKSPVSWGALTCLEPAHLFVPTMQSAVAHPAEEVAVQVHGVQLQHRDRPSPIS